MALAIPLGLAIGLAVGMVGGGGAILTVPVLVYVLGESAHEATTASLLIVAVSATAGGIGHASQRRVCWRHAAAFAVPAIAGTAIGTLANQAVGGSVLLLLFAPVMLAAAWFIWRTAAVGQDERDQLGGEARCPALRPGVAVFAGLLVGTLTGFFGVGGGFVVVPILVVALHLPLRSAIGTSLVIVTAVALVGLASHLLAGNTIDVGPTLGIAAACAAGAIAGGPLAQRVSQPALARGFALVVTVVAAWIVVATALIDGTPGA